MGSHDTKRTDRDGAGITLAAGSVVDSADEFISFVIDEPAPDVCVVRVRGELDLLTTGLLDHNLQRHIEGNPGRVVVDLSEVTFLGAAALTSLLTAKQAATRWGVQLYLTGADHRAVARPLKITKLWASFDIRPTVKSIVADRPPLSSIRTEDRTAWPAPGRLIGPSLA